ncbi:MAG TPA: DUF1028 domain-containing protein, partial [Planococcus sp. (in: firmicutes)]|nr:DUF1028 domain-containing protein [Planococcus sp. (in: firmicutes)]
PEGLELLEKGLSPDEVIAKLIADDPGRNLRQVAVINAQGEASAFTGEECFDWAGHKIGKNHSCQGNILVSEETVTAMSNTFEQSTGPLAERLIKALASAQHAGGDSRGKQSAAVYVLQEGAGYGGYNDVKVDLRVDDHPEPIEELVRLYELHKVFGESTDEQREIEGELFEEIKGHLVRHGLLDSTSHAGYNDTVKNAMKTFTLRENFDDRWTEERLIDEVVLDHLRKE